LRRGGWDLPVVVATRRRDTITARIRPTCVDGQFARLRVLFLVTDRFRSFRRRVPAIFGTPIAPGFDYIDLPAFGSGDGAAVPERCGIRRLGQCPTLGARGEPHRVRIWPNSLCQQGFDPLHPVCLTATLAGPILTMTLPPET
jgi:hypothetical protein